MAFTIKNKIFCDYVLKSKVLLFFNSSSRHVFEVELHSHFHCRDKQMQIINTRTFNLSPSHTLKMGIFEKKSSLI